MSDGIEIGSSGVISVDTASLREAAGRLRAVSLDVDQALESLRLASVVAPPNEQLVGQVQWRLRDATYTTELQAAALRDLAAALDGTAALYELVELRAAREAAQLSGDRLSVERIDRRISVLGAAWPDAWESSRLVAQQYHDDWRGAARGKAAELVAALWGGPLSPLGAGVTIVGSRLLGAKVADAIDRADLGRISAGARLSGPPPAVDIRRLAPPAPTTAPADLAQAAARVPGGAQARVRVERYAMPDGTRQFAVYVTGTQNPALGTDDPWDSTSNVELYQGRDSASYEATRQALHDAGAEPGDVVHALGHSQGGMIVSRLALEGEYDVRTVVTFGSPQEAALGPDTLSVALRHTDDPVPMLAEGGRIARVGAADSMVVTREAGGEGWLGPFDALGLPEHALSEYTETAELLDASADPRVDSLRAVFDELGAATSVEVSEYAATRPD